MKIKIYSFGTPESRDFRCILEGMYRKVGKVTNVQFPENEKEAVELEIEGEFDSFFEYGIHRMDRISPRYAQPVQHKSFVMVEIDGKRREELVAVYDFNPEKAKNLLNGSETKDLFGVLGGKPLGLRPMMEHRRRIPIPQMVVAQM